MTKSVCSIEDCGRPAVARGWCNRHYNRWQRYGDPLHGLDIPPVPLELQCEIDGCTQVKKQSAPPWGMVCNMHALRIRKTGEPGDNVPTRIRSRIYESYTCSVDGCENPVWARGLCNTHYSRQRINGETGPAELLRQKQEISGMTEGGYIRLRYDGVSELEHRHVMEEMLGRELLPNENVHHINGVKHDNRPENLELWISSQPKGQRVPDLLAWAHEIIDRYESEVTV